MASKVVDRLIVALEARVDKLEKGFNKASKHSERSGQRMRRAFAAVGLAIYGVIRMVDSLVQAYANQEAMEKKLESNLRLVTKTANEHADALDRLKNQAKDLSQTTLFADEQIINAQAMLATFALTPEQIEQVTPRLLDMASASYQATGKQVDLQAAAIALGKGMNGQAGMLARYGVVLRDATKDSNDFNMILEDLDANYKGLAQSVGATTTGTLAQFKNTIGDLKEELGGQFAPIVRLILPLLMEVAETLLPFVTNLLSKILPPIMDILQELMPVIKEILDLVMPIIEKVVALVMPFLKDIVKLILPPIMKILRKLIPIFETMIDKLLPPLMDALMAIIEPLVDIAVLLIDELYPIMEPIADTMIELLKVSLELVAAVLKPLMPLLKELIEAVLPVLKPLLEGLAGIIGLIAEGIKAVLQGIMAAWNWAFNKNPELVKGGEGTLTSSIASMVDEDQKRLQEQQQKAMESIGSFGTALAVKESQSEGGGDGKAKKAPTAFEKFMQDLEQGDFAKAVLDATEKYQVLMDLIEGSGVELTESQKTEYDRLANLNDELLARREQLEYAQTLASSDKEHLEIKKELLSNQTSINDNLQSMYDLMEERGSQLEEEMKERWERIGNGISNVVNQTIGGTFDTVFGEMMNKIKINLDKAEGMFGKFIGGVWNSIVELATKVIASSLIQLAVKLIRMLAGDPTAGFGAGGFGGFLWNAIKGALGFDYPPNDAVVRKWTSDLLSNIGTGASNALSPGGMNVSGRNKMPDIVLIQNGTASHLADSIRYADDDERQALSREFRKVSKIDNDNMRGNV